MQNTFELRKNRMEKRFPTKMEIMNKRKERAFERGKKRDEYEKTNEKKINYNK